MSDRAIEVLNDIRGVLTASADLLRGHRVVLFGSRAAGGVSGIICLYLPPHCLFPEDGRQWIVGNNQMWCAQSLELIDNQIFLTSGGMGAMGYSLPASIGASITLGNAPVVAIAGDGGFQINVQELQTIRRNDLPVKIVILNNHCLGMIRQFQDSYFGSCYQSTVWGYTAPDFAKIALAYGIESCSISRPGAIGAGLKKLWENRVQPFLLEVLVDIHTNVSPKMMFGSPMTKMEPSG